MQFLADFKFPYIIDNVSGPVVPKYCWYYDVEVNDFLLRPIHLLEETTGPTVTVMINGLTFKVPASWNLLVVDEETKLVDTVQITQCTSSNYQAFLMHPDENRPAFSSVVLLDLSMREACVHVTIPKMHMILHPVGPITNGTKDRNFSCLLSPQDLGKHMIGMTAMEVLI